MHAWLVTFEEELKSFFGNFHLADFFIETFANPASAEI